MAQIPVQVIEPPHNVMRTGPENAARFFRVRPSGLHYVRAGTAYADTLAALAAAQVWQSSPASYGVDLTGDEWLLFTLPQNGGAATLYAAMVHTVAALAATQDVLVLDFLTFHEVEHFRGGLLSSSSGGGGGGGGAPPWTRPPFYPPIAPCTSPVEASVGVMPYVGGSQNLYTRGRIAVSVGGRYVACINPYGATLAVIDVADYRNPVVIALTSMPGTTQTLSLIAPTIVCATGFSGISTPQTDACYLYDLATPASPHYIGTGIIAAGTFFADMPNACGPAPGVVVVGDDYPHNEQIDVFQYTSSSVTYVGSANTGNGPGGTGDVSQDTATLVALDSTTVAVWTQPPNATTGVALVIYDISTATPTLISRTSFGSYPLGVLYSYLVTSNHLAIVLADSTVRCIDVSVRTAPVEVGSVSFSGGLAAADALGSTVYLMALGATSVDPTMLVTVDCSTPTAPVLSGSEVLLSTTTSGPRQALTVIRAGVVAVYAPSYYPPGSLGVLTVAGPCVANLVSISPNHGPASGGSAVPRLTALLPADGPAAGGNDKPPTITALTPPHGPSAGGN